MRPLFNVGFFLRPLLREVFVANLDIDEDLRLSLPERPCCRGVMQTDLVQFWALVLNNPSQNVLGSPEG